MIFLAKKFAKVQENSYFKHYGKALICCCDNLADKKVIASKNIRNKFVQANS